MTWTADPLVARLIDSIRSRDAREFGACYASDAVLVEPLFPRPHVGRDEIVAGEQALFDAFSDVQPEVRALIVDGRSRAVELVTRAENTGPIQLDEDTSVPATGRRIEVPMAWLIDPNEEGLIASERDYFYTATLLRQLGRLE